MRISTALLADSTLKRNNVGVFTTPKGVARSHGRGLKHSRGPCQHGAAMTQREWAAKLKLPQSTIAKIETAHRGVDVFELIEWCRACEVDPQTCMRHILKNCRL